MFDQNVIDALLNQTVEEPLETRITPVPEGDYIAQPDGPPTLESFQGKKDPSKSFIRLTMIWDIQDEGLKASLNRTEVKVRQQFIIDLDSNGKLATGPDKNVRLGQLFEAGGLNAGGASIAQLGNIGRCLIRVKQRADESDPETKYSEVSKVVKAG